MAGYLARRPVLRHGARHAAGPGGVFRFVHRTQRDPHQAIADVGILLHLFLVPALALALMRAGLVPARYPGRAARRGAA